MTTFADVMRDRPTMPGQVRVTKLIHALRRWSNGRSQIRHLTELPDALLSDIGLTRSAVEQQFRAPFWRSPDFDRLEQIRNRLVAGL